MMILMIVVISRQFIFVMSYIVNIVITTYQFVVHANRNNYTFLNDKYTR